VKITTINAIRIYVNLIWCVLLIHH
jgi:hypothetical protein